MSLSSALSSAITKGFYVNEVGEKISYKDIFIELFTYAKVNGYASTIRQLTLKYNYVDRRYNELKSKIDAIIAEMNNSSYSDKYDIFLSFIQSNADSDSVNMSIFNTTNVVLSNRIASLKDVYHEMSILANKRELFITMMTNLTKNKNNMDTIISDIKSI